MSSRTVGPITRVCIVVVASAIVSSAQGPITVPGSGEWNEGSTRLAFPGTTAPRLVQWVIDASHIQGLLGRSVDSLTFRRDAQWLEAVPASSVDLVVRIGTGCPAVDASPTPSANLQDGVEVYRGLLSLPASPAAPAGPSWNASSAVTIPFATAYPYAGGPLCIEVRGIAAPGGSSLWPIDALGTGHSGTVAYAGRSCSSSSGPDGISADVFEHDLAPGKTSVFFATGADRSAAWLLLGLPLTPPIDLTVLGAPTCHLHVAELATLAASFAADPRLPRSPARSRVAVHIPGSSNLLGARFRTQWLEISPSFTLATSNALDCTLASTMPSLGVAMIVATDTATAGAVTQDVAPVLRLGSH